jgi:hypothetical protein
MQYSLVPRTCCGRGQSSIVLDIKVTKQLTEPPDIDPKSEEPRDGTEHVKS